MPGWDTEAEPEQQHPFLSQRNQGTWRHPVWWTFGSTSIPQMISLNQKSPPDTNYWSTVSRHPSCPKEALFATGSILWLQRKPALEWSWHPGRQNKGMETPMFLMTSSSLLGVHIGLAKKFIQVFPALVRQTQTNFLTNLGSHPTSGIFILFGSFSEQWIWTLENRQYWGREGPLLRTSLPARLH